MYTMLMKDLSKDFLITTLSQNNLNLRVKTCHGFLVLLMHRHMSVSVQDMCKKKPDMSCCIRSSLLGLFCVRRRFSFGTVCRKVNALFRKLSGGIKWTRDTSFGTGSGGKRAADIAHKFARRDSGGHIPRSQRGDSRRPRHFV